MTGAINYYFQLHQVTTNLSSKRAILLDYFNRGLQTNMGFDEAHNLSIPHLHQKGGLLMWRKVSLNTYPLSSIKFYKKIQLKSSYNKYSIFVITKGEL